MNTSRREEIIRQVERYVNGSLDRSGYRAWLVEQVWSVESCDSPAQEDILDEIEGLDAEYTSGHWSEDELKVELRDRILVSRLKQTSA